MTVLKGILQLTLACLLLPAVPAPAQTAAAVSDERFAILPMANYSAVNEAHGLLEPLLEKQLTEAGLDFIPSSRLRGFLRDNRIRSIGWIGRHDAQQVALNTGARYLILGSWDVLRREPNPEVGLSLRILDTLNMCLVAAVNTGATAEDEAGLFGRGRLPSLERVAAKAMTEALAGLFPLGPCQPNRLSYRGCYNLALVPLDNFSGTEHAGDIFTNLLLSQLMAAGYSVVEPGFIRELGLSREVVNRGGVDLGSGQAIFGALGACRVVTGDVDEFYTGAGDPTRSTPRFSVRLRVTIPLDGLVYDMTEISGAGDDSDGLFQRGRQHALIPLTVRKIRDFSLELYQQNRKDIIHGR